MLTNQNFIYEEIKSRWNSKNWFKNFFCHLLPKNMKIKQTVPHCGRAFVWT